ncbi:MAG: EF-P beta-lysylation protein EpmB [Steroidobacteraceae bacterium]
MITATPPTRHHSPAHTWQQDLADAVTSADELLALLGLQPTDVALDPDAAGFPLRVPRGFVARMRPGDPHDPLLRQVLPLALEGRPVAGFIDDPVGDSAARRAPGLLQKYHGRALLITTEACAVHCRYCFRRAYPYAQQVDPVARWDSALAEVAADPSIRELILSGGDPWSLSTGRLDALTRRLRGIPHLARLRIHTRQPIVLPSRVDRALLDWLAGLPWQRIVVVHANHAQEIDADVAAALTALRDSGATVLNQSVLLAGVNDSADALVALSERLLSAGTLPYYIHLLDRVRGAAHFEVDEARARQLLAEIATRLPGYLVPKLVRESAGEPAKRAIAAGWPAT